MKVTAFFNNGRREDVTRWTKYTSGNQSVATVDSDGKVKIVGKGEGTVTAWYLSKLSIATVSVPYDQPVLTQAFEAFIPRNFIDERVLEKLRELRIEHRDLDDVITRLQMDLRVDELQLKRLKKRKLMLKDQITQMEDTMLPDIIA
jgi:hypothetical protein